MYKKITLFNFIAMVFMSFYLANAYAGPVDTEDVILTQADGSRFIATPYGDEWHSGYETKDGYTILFDSTTKNWVYADIASDGSLIKTKYVVSKDMPPLMPKHIRPFLPPSPNSMKSLSSITAKYPVNPATGDQNVLVILVQFADIELQTTPDQWSELIFSNTSFSRVRDYYNEVSYNNIDLIPASETYGTDNDGVVVVTLSYDHPNTADNTSGTNGQITKDALIAANPYVTFSQFDTNIDDYISSNELHIIIVVAGYENSYGGSAAACSPSVHAHWSPLDPDGTIPPPILDERTLVATGHGGYVQLGEWHCKATDNPGHMATIGPIAHELGHSLGLPDEYDVDGSSNGIGRWGLMGNSWKKCSGGYSGNCPSHPTAWDKSYLKWLVPTPISGSQTVSIPDITTNATAFRLLDNPDGVDWSFLESSGTGEYFLVENRQPNGYNAGQAGDGLLIWHIWEGASSSNTEANTNEAGSRLIDLREADGLNDLDFSINSGDAGDVFPGSSNNTVFNYRSKPSSNLYCSSGTGFCNWSYVSVSNISESGSTMTADMIDTEVEMSSGLQFIGESQGSVTVTVRRRGDTSGTSTVNYATSDDSAISGIDYTPVSGTLSFNAEEDNKTITVPIIDDSITEFRERFKITLSSPVGAALSFRETRSVYIRDNEPTAIQFSSASYSVNETSANVVLTVQRIGDTSDSSTIQYFSASFSTGTWATAGSDYTEVSGPLSFSAGQSYKYITVPIINDTVDEPDERFIVKLWKATGAERISPSLATVYILDDDQGDGL